MPKKLIIIDAHALLHRSYHALPPLVSPDGKLVNGVYGFLLVFFKILEELKPDYVIATFDLPGPTLRHQVFKEYKAKRVKAPENFYQQIEILKEILKIWGIMYLEKEGYEADDLIGTTVEKFRNQKDLEIIILTGDLDTLQLVKDNVKVYTFRRGIQDKVIYDVEKVKERFDLEPEQLRDYKALKGDPSDNILGVPKIGEKLAQKLIQKYKSLDGLYQAIENGEKIDVSGSVLESLKKHKEQAYFSQQLVTIVKDIDIDIPLEKAFYKNPPEELILLFKKLGFQSFIKRAFSLTQGALLEVKEKKQINIKRVDSKNLSFLLQNIIQARKIGLKLDFDGKNYLSREVQRLKIITDQEQNDVYVLEKESINNFIEQLGNIIQEKEGKEIILVERKIILEEFPILEKIESYCLDLDILAWLIDSERKKYNLLDLARFFLKKNFIDEEEAFIEIFDLAEQIKIKAESFGLWNVYQEIEKPLVKILADMEKNGVFLNKDKFQEILKIIQKEKKDLEEKIYQITGFIFNLNSPIQVQEVLFQRLKIPTNGLEKTKTGKISTDLEALKKIEKNHPIISLIISWRQLEKLINSFLVPLPNFISSLSSRIHPVWDQM
ncbi:MAG: DNA polymerase, partial [Minisyncoccia bacterium]